MDSINMPSPIDLEGGDGPDGGSQDVQDVNTSHSTAATGKRKKSDVWLEFEIFRDKDNKERARCKACNNSYAIGSASHGTTNLKKHLKVCHKRDHNDISQMHLNHEMKSRDKRYDQGTYRELMAMSIMEHNYPFLYVEHRGTRRVHNYLNSDCKAYCRNTAKADCLKLYAQAKEKLKLVIERAPGRICLTSDCWSSITSEGYMCLTAHFVDENWKLRSAILNFSHVHPPHTGVVLSEHVFNFLKDWGIEKKIFSLTLDNASNCDNMKDVLKDRMKSFLLCNGDFFKVRCSAHILNLIVQEGLKVASVALWKIRESVKYVKGSESRLRQFIHACEHVGVDFREGLRLDVTTRWNSTFFMLECVLKYRKVFDHYALIEPGYRTCPSKEEWDRGESICKFLKPFADITTLMSGSDYPTANLYFKNVWKIQLCLLEGMENQDEVLSTMSQRMLKKFHKYWKNYSVVLAMAIVLDPRYKLIFVEFCYKKLDESTCDEKVANVRVSLNNLFQEYAKQKASQSSNQHSLSVVCHSNVEDDISEFDHYEDIDANNRSELDLYLEEPKVSRLQHANMDILGYWKDNQGRYLILSMMARDLMSIPITTVASESAFSIGAKVLTKYRSSITPENAEALICTRNWLFQYECESDEPSDEQLVVPIAIKKITESRGSNA